MEPHSYRFTCSNASPLYRSKFTSCILFSGQCDGFLIVHSAVLYVFQNLCLEGYLLKDISVSYGILNQYYLFLSILTCSISVFVQFNENFLALFFLQPLVFQSSDVIFSF